MFDPIEIHPADRLCVALSLKGARLIELSGHIDACRHFNQPIRMQVDVDEIREVIDALEQSLRAYERTREASVEIIPVAPPAPAVDDHQAEINAGAVSFAAFRDARGGA